MSRRLFAVIWIKYLNFRVGTRNNFSKLKTFTKRQIWDKKNSYIGPSIWNSFPDSIKKENSLNTFKTQWQKTLFYLNNHITCVCEYVYLICICLYICGSVYIYTYEYILLLLFLSPIHSQGLFSFIYFSHFHGNFRNNNENKALLHLLCYLSHCSFINICSNISILTFEF